MKEEIIIIGAGGHGKVIADAILKASIYNLIGFVDVNEPVGKKIFGDFRVIDKQENIKSLISDKTKFIIGIGNIEVKKKIQSEFSSMLSWATIIHPSAIIAQDVKIGEGSVVLANAIINAGTIVGDFTIIDSGVIVDHDCKVGDFSHLAIGTLVGSNSELSSNLKTELAKVFKPFTIQ